MEHWTAMTAVTATSLTGSFWRPSAPAAPPLRVAHELRSQNRLAAIVMAAIFAFALALTAAPHATGLDVFGSETRVAAQTDLSASFVGLRGAETPATVGGNRAFAYDGVLGCCVAPSGVADDGARFVVDSTGSTVLRAQGPQRWINVSEHAARRMTQRGIPIDAVDNALTTQSFDYFHAGVTKTGFYDAANNLFVGTVDDVVTTVFHPSAGQGYIDNLLAAGP